MRYLLIVVLMTASSFAQTSGPLNVGPGIQFNDGASLAVSQTGKARVRYHLGNNRLEMSLNGGGWVAMGGGGGGGSTLNAAYAAGSSPADSTLHLDNTRGGLQIVDAVVPISDFPFSVQANSGFYIYLGADKSGIWSNMPSLTGDILPQLLLIPGSHSSMTASTEVINYTFSASPWQFLAGPISTQRWMRIERPTYSFTSASTITTAATVEIEGAPAAGTNATITNPYALNVASGLTNLGGSITTPSIGTTSSALHALPTGTGAVVSTDATQTLTNKTITAPVLSGSATGTYTLAGTPTLGSTITLSSGVNIVGSTTSTNTFSRRLSNGTAPSCAVGPNAMTGGSPSCSTSGTAERFTVTLTTGTTSPGLAADDIFVVTHAGGFSYPTKAQMMCRPGDDLTGATQNQFGTNNWWISICNSTTACRFRSLSSGGFSASTVYTYDCQIGGY